MGEESTRKKCLIDDDVYADQIAGWLRNNLQAPNVNAHLKELDPQHREYTAGMYSRHRIKCLGMAKLARGRVKTAVIDQSAADLERAASISDADGIRLAKSAFFDRLKRNPADIQTKDLVSVIGALSRGTKDGGNDSEHDKITQAMGDLLSDDSPSS